jgi:phage tail sheath gpL-like
MPTNERPGVYSSVEVTSTLSGSATGKVVGLAAAAEIGTKGACVKISSYGEAVSAFGSDCSITKLIEILFSNGASAVQAVAAEVGTAPDTDDYTQAFAALMVKEDVSIMICDSDDSAVHAAMMSAIGSAVESCKYRIGIVETGGTVTEVTACAAALNCERMVMVYPAESGTEATAGAVAAAVAGAVASGGDPALPLNGAVLEGVDIDRRFTDAEITGLVQAGVTPVEYVSGEVCVVRGVTTRTTTNSVSDATWRELTTVLIIDDIVPSIRAGLRKKFPRVKNTEQTRGAIRTQVLIELESKKSKEIIESYGTVTAQASVDDPTVCEVSFVFTVAHGLNSINLTAHISV